MDKKLEAVVNKVVGELMLCEKYRFVDNKIIASVVRDTICMIDGAVTKAKERKE